MKEKQIQATPAVTNIEFTLKFTLTINEAKALEALTKYGTKEFLSVFYQEMGSDYLKPYENGLCSLFEKTKRDLEPEIRKIDKATLAIQAALADINK